MIDSFEIKNYRNLDGLKIKSFGKVNLIAGKNNTGKTNFLQALELFVSDFSIEILKSHFIKRRELEIRKYRNENSSNIENLNFEVFSNLFKDRIVNDIFEENIILKSLDKSTKVNIAFLAETDDNEFSRFRQMTLEEVKGSDLSLIRKGLEINVNNERVRLIAFNRDFSRTFFGITKSDVKFQFIETDSIEKGLNSSLWDNIALSESENYIIDALKIIDESIERLTFIGENNSERYAVVKIKNKNKVIPLKTMGDGINRILTIILALANVENGYLFIDEFENGLHYSVQEDLWKIIFHLAEQLNIQIFATTHSNDCIDAFQKVVNSPQNNVSGQYIRLENKNNEIREVSYSDDEIKYASENDIEVR